jgi:hypothetical protein
VPKTKKRQEHWKVQPEEHDFPAAAAYLSLHFPPATVTSLVAALQAADTTRAKAKDLLRASGLPLLPASDPEVAKDLRRVADGASLSPVLLVRGRGTAGVPLIVADGYHRICASYRLSEDEDIPCRLADAP